MRTCCDGLGQRYENSKGIAMVTQTQVDAINTMIAERKIQATTASLTEDSRIKLDWNGDVEYIDDYQVAVEHIIQVTA